MPSPLPTPLTRSMSDKMLAFVEHYIDLGGRHQGRAAIMAGYSPSAADAVASRLLRRNDVLALLRHVTETRIKADAIASADTLRELRDDPGTPAAVRRQCANDLLDRAGLLVEKFSTMRHVLEDRVTLSGPRIWQMLRDTAPEMGIEIAIRDQAKLNRWIKIMDRPGSNDTTGVPEAIDADFEEAD